MNNEMNPEQANFRMDVRRTHVNSRMSRRERIIETNGRSSVLVAGDWCINRHNVFAEDLTAAHKGAQVR
jgi:hypothetical protein